MDTDLDAPNEDAVFAASSFTPWDRAAITSCLGAFPDYSVEFAEDGGIGYAFLRNGQEACGPQVLLTRQEGLTGFAATWPDGRQLRAGLNASLAMALSFIAQVLDDASSIFIADGPADATDCCSSA